MKVLFLKSAVSNSLSIRSTRKFIFVSLTLRIVPGAKFPNMEKIPLHRLVGGGVVLLTQVASQSAIGDRSPLRVADGRCHAVGGGGCHTGFPLGMPAHETVPGA